MNLNKLQAENACEEVYLHEWYNFFNITTFF